MPKQAMTLRRAAPLAATFLLADALYCFLPQLQSERSSYFFQLVAPAVGLWACCWRALTVKSRARGLWWMFAAGLAAWGLGMVFSAWEDLLQHLPFETASVADFAFFFYGVPILFALSTPIDSQPASLFTWLDGAQVVFAGYLTYLTIFGQVPFSARGATPIPISLLVVTYHLENVALTIGAALRMIASPKGGEQRRFYGTLCFFLAVYGLGVGVYNEMAMQAANHLAPNVLVDGPFILLGCLILTLPRLDPVAPRAVEMKTRLAMFIDLSSPVFFTLALLTLGLVVLKDHYFTGVVAIAFALATYGVRTTTLQIRLRQTQGDLQQARDRLENLSLQDALTGIANRRNFDRTLESEWHRAVRTHQVLSLLLIDLDYFKNVNDAHGHPYGDSCLAKVAQALRGAASRSGDLVARYGGEEFAAILPGTSEEAAYTIAERMREAVLELKIPNETELGAYVSVSIGICTASRLEKVPPSALVNSADKTLYLAKQQGRNRSERCSLQG